MDRNTEESERRCRHCREPIDCANQSVQFCDDVCQTLYERGANPASALRGFGVPQRYILCSFESLRNGEKYQQITEAFPGECKSLFLTGNVGAGKTHLAVAVLRRIMLVEPAMCQFIPATRLFMDLRRGFERGYETESQVLDRCIKYGTIVLDDLGAEKSTEYVRQSWYHIIDSRYAQMLPTIITSNMSLDEISDVYGDRIASRISSGIVVEFTGDDYRLQMRRREDI